MFQNPKSKTRNPKLHQKSKTQIPKIPYSCPCKTATKWILNLTFWLRKSTKLRPRTLQPLARQSAGKVSVVRSYIFTHKLILQFWPFETIQDLDYCFWFDKQTKLQFILDTESSAVRPPVLHVFLFSWFPFFSWNLFIFLGNLKFKSGHAPKTKNQRILRNVWAKNFFYRHCFICCF